MNVDVSSDIRDLYANMERARTCDSQAKRLPGMFASINNSTDENGEIIGCKFHFDIDLRRRADFCVLQTSLTLVYLQLPIRLYKSSMVSAKPLYCHE